MKKNLLLLIDGNSLINRAYYALPMMTDSKGVPTNAVYGFLTMLTKAIVELQPQYVAVAFDLKAKTFRHKMFEGYKATRKPMPDDLRVQVDLLKEVLKSMKIAELSCEGFEADDIIGTASCKFDVPVIIVTGDRDALQLVNDRVSLYYTKRGISEVSVVTPQSIEGEFGMRANQVIDYKALCGDSSDNIPGVAGVGDKTAQSLLQKYDTLDGVFDNLEQIGGKLHERLAGGKDMAYLSKQLATIDCNMDLGVELNDMRLQFPFDATVAELFAKLEFKSLLKRQELFFEGQAQQSTVFEAKECKIEGIESLKKVSLKTDCLALLILPQEILFSTQPDCQYRASFLSGLESLSFGKQDCLEYLREVLCDERVCKLFYDSKAVLKECDACGFLPNNYVDLKLSQYLINLQDLDNLATVLANNDINTDKVCAAMHLLRRVHDSKMQELGLTHLYYDIELKLVRVLFDMEKQGFRLDMQFLNQLEGEYFSELSDLTKQIFLSCGQEFNINSPKQMGIVLFDKLKLPYPKKTKGGSWSTSADILEEIKHTHECIPLILRYRTVFKIKTTYLDGLKRQANMQGVVHTEFKQTLTTTGRLSSVEPNLQNIPIRTDEGRILRRLFVPSKGHKLVIADYSQIELRLLAHLSGDKNMIEAYNHGEDIHTATAAAVFGVRLDEVTYAMRRQAKAVNFGIVYGMSDFGLAQSLNVTRTRAKELMEKYFATYPQISLYLKSCIKDAQTTGYARTMFGRLRRIDELKSANFNLRAFGERAAMNMPMQGSAADLIKIAMLNVHKSLQGMQSKLILQVHDELIIDAPEHEVAAASDILRMQMQNAVQLSVPLVAEVGIGDNWYDAK